MPQYRYRGSNASLLCKYELQPNEELFSLKWYKEDTEFYRHTPPDPLSQPPPMTNYGVEIRPQQHFNTGLVQTWPVPGIKIDEEHSRPQHVILKRVTFKSTGTYRCEVTAVLRQRNGFGIQGFEMKESINKMVVVGKWELLKEALLHSSDFFLDFLELPASQPVITGGNFGHHLQPLSQGEEHNNKYKPGDVLNLTCTSAPSNPPARLEWILNDRPVSKQLLKTGSILAN